MAEKQVLLFRFAFIDFESVDDAKKSVKAMNGHTLDGRELKVDFAQERGSGEYVFVLLLLCNSAPHYLYCALDQNSQFS